MEELLSKEENPRWERATQQKEAEFWETIQREEEKINEKERQEEDNSNKQGELYKLQKQLLQLEQKIKNEEKEIDNL